MIISTPAPSAVFSLAHAVLRILIVLNWLYGAAIFVLLALGTNTGWVMSAFQLNPSPDVDRLVWGMRATAVLGLLAVPLHYVLLRRLLSIVETVGERDPFVAANACRLRAMAWMLLWLQVLGIVIAVVARFVSTPANPLRLDAGFSLNGWLAVLLTFLLAHVFAEGARMREDLEGTI